MDESSTKTSWLVKTRIFLDGEQTLTHMTSRISDTFLRDSWWPVFSTVTYSMLKIFASWEQPPCALVSPNISRRVLYLIVHLIHIYVYMYMHRYHIFTIETVSCKLFICVEFFWSDPRLLILKIWHDDYIYYIYLPNRGKLFVACVAVPIWDNLSFRGKCALLTHENCRWFLRALPGYNLNDADLVTPKLVSRDRSIVFEDGHETREKSRSVKFSRNSKRLEESPPPRGNLSPKYQLHAAIHKYAFR